MPPEVTEFNEDEIEAPEWLNAEFFTTVLKHCRRRDDIQVKRFTMTPATARGDHYASVMFRGSVYYETSEGKEHKSLIVKTMPEMEGHKKELLGDSYIFETEIGMYADVLPKIEAILRAAGDDTVIGPPCLYHSLSPKKLIVFEDIVPLGYTVIRNREVNLDEIKGAYTKLAKMQAVSLKMIQEDPSCFDIYRYHMMVMESIKHSSYMMNSVHNFYEMLKSEPSFEEYVKYFADSKDNIIENTKKLFTEFWSDRREGALYLLCHGDFHAKNMMFKLSPNGQYEDVLLLDYQMSYMGSFALDLIYSMFLLVDEDIRLNHMNELFTLYIDVFNTTADKIGYTGRRPEMNLLLDELKANRHWLVYLMCTFYPMWGAFKRGGIDMEQMYKSEEYQKSFFRNKQFIDELKVLIPKFKALGYFDNL